MDVTLYKNFSVENKLTKNITQVAQYAGVQLVDPVNDAEVSIRMTVPTADLRWDAVNYFEWDDAYYYLESVDMQANGISVINGRMDLLMTYRSSIADLNVKVVRSTSHGSPRLEDDLRQFSVDSSRAVVSFPAPFSGAELAGSYVFVTSQKGYQT